MQTSCEHRLDRRAFLKQSKHGFLAAASVATTQSLLRAAQPKVSNKQASKQLPTAIIYDDVFKTHITGRSHPESPQRLDAVVKALRGAKFANKLKWLTPRTASDTDLLRCHDKKYIETAKKDIQSGAASLSSGDTSVCRDSLKAARQAAGAACLAVDSVMASKCRNVFCVVRPPGHHATPDRGMGFCIFNNVAVAARYAQQKHKVGKVLIVDWDVHHGNGTQDIFYQDDSVFFFSTHQSPWYPGTGARAETGRGQGLGATLNRPFAAGAGRKEIVGAFENDLLPAVNRFKPELVIISAGFDSRQGDPLGRFRLSDNDFVELTSMMLDVARQHAGNRLISVLEGGYNLTGLAKASAAHCGRLCRVDG